MQAGSPLPPPGNFLQLKLKREAVIINVAVGGNFIDQSLWFETVNSKALFIWSGLPHLGGMFLSFRSYDFFIPLRWAGFLLKMTFRLMWLLISVLSHSRLRSNPKSISLEWDSPLNCLHMRNIYLPLRWDIPPHMKRP